MSQHILLAATFLTLALLIPITLFFRVFRTLVRGMDASVKAREAEEAQAEAARTEAGASASSVETNRTES